MRTFIVASSLVALFLLGSNAKAEGIYDHIPSQSATSGGRSSAAKGVTATGQPCDLTSAAPIAPAPRPQVLPAQARVAPPAPAPTPVPAPAPAPKEDKAKDSTGDKLKPVDSKGDVDAGKLVYAKCTTCHATQPKDELKNLDAKDPQTKIDVITGKGTTDMKARANLTDKEAADLEAFFQSQL